jgi:hypothetical protein
MIIDAEERMLYWGYTHMNIACRDINDDEEPDMVGLERILYDVGCLAVTKLSGLEAYDDELSDESENDTGNDYESLDYESVEIENNPFEYESNDDDFGAPQKYMTGDIHEIAEPENLLFDEDDIPSIDIEDLEEPDEEPALPPAAEPKKSSDYGAKEKEAA